MDNKIKRTDLVIFFIASLMFFIGGCGWPEKKKKMAEPVEPDSEITQNSKISDLVEAFSQGQRTVEGYGIVGGLNGTGSAECPPQIRDYLKKYIIKNLPGNQIDIDDFIDSYDTAVVKTYGVIPDTASINQYFDLEATALAGSQTTSLKNGWLYQSDLKAAGGFGVTLNVLAEATGPIYIDTLGESTGNEKTGYILAGGSVAKGYRLALALKRPDYKTASLIRNRINERFGNNIAKAVSDGVIELKIPRIYREQKKRFLRILSATYLIQTKETVAQRINDLVKKLAVEDNKESSEIELEAIGRQSIGKMSALLKLSNEEVKLRAARCMLNLGSDQGLSILRQIALDENSPHRIEALEAVVTSASRNDSAALARALLKDNDFKIVKIAYEKLRKINDIAITQTLVGRNFYLEQLPLIPHKRIFVYRSGQPRIVIFGAPMYCKKNLFIQSQDQSITLNAPTGQNYVSIIKKHPKRPNVLIKKTCSFEIGDIIKTLCEEAISDKPGKEAGLNTSYGEMIALLKEMVEKDAIEGSNVTFQAGPLPEIPQISRNY